jgi:hypothetical protein
MPLHTDLVLPALAALSGLALLSATAFILVSCATVRALLLLPFHCDGPGRHVTCRYCHFGRAYPREETVRVENHDLVEVTCFVCRTCSLPQWRVQRSPVLKRAA